MVSLLSSEGLEGVSQGKEGVTQGGERVSGRTSGMSLEISVSQRGSSGQFEGTHVLVWNSPMHWRVFGIPAPMH